MADEHEVDDKIKAFALSKCAEYVLGWPQSAEGQKVFEVRGGLTNKLYLCEAPGRRILLRMYCGQSGDMLPRILDVAAACILSTMGQAPTTYGVFDEGRLEHWIDGRTLITEDLHVSEISLRIATDLAQFHSLVLPLKKTPTWIFDVLQRMLPPVLTAEFTAPALQEQFSKVMAFNLQAELDWLLALLRRIPRNVGFCHNDLQEGNIIMRPDGTLQFIDFEYIGYNFREFDVANHFCEMSICYSEPLYPNFAIDRSKYPTIEQQTRFAQVYLEVWKGTVTDSQSSGDSAINSFALASHFMWALWGVRNALSPIPFGYLEYSLARLEQYRLHKEYIQQHWMEL